MVVSVEEGRTVVRVLDLGDVLLRAGVRPDRIEVRRGAGRYLERPIIASLIADAGIDVVEVGD
jgi:hypothetical protein